MAAAAVLGGHSRRAVGAQRDGVRRPYDCGGRTCVGDRGEWQGLSVKSSHSELEASHNIWGLERVAAPILPQCLPLRDCRDRPHRGLWGPGPAEEATQAQHQGHASVAADGSGAHGAPGAPASEEQTRSPQGQERPGVRDERLFLAAVWEEAPRPCGGHLCQRQQRAPITRNAAVRGPSVRALQSEAQDAAGHDPAHGPCSVLQAPAFV
mmetsp:Transcript_86943/g.145055  ORF Transcript_86943/g.145055 Transcript_86943/m.145055 type:complete len:209 (+) Transcript_86943:210-836(+)